MADDTLDYVLRDMTHPEGGFYSAEDADSVPPALAHEPGARATEGAFYLWRRDELEALLGADAAIVAARFDVRPGGNVAHDPHGEFGDGNILHVASDPAEIARQTGRSEEDVLRVVADARAVMLQARAAAAAAAARRQGADGVERPDDRRLRARGALDACRPRH